jgi:hypothetical protein
MIAAYHVEGANDWPVGVEEEGATLDVKEGTVDLPKEGTTDLTEEGTTGLPQEGRNRKHVFQAISRGDAERMLASRNTQESPSDRTRTNR